MKNQWLWLIVFAACVVGTLPDYYFMQEDETYAERLIILAVVTFLASFMPIFN